MTKMTNEWQTFVWGIDRNIPVRRSISRVKGHPEIMILIIACTWVSRICMENVTEFILTIYHFILSGESTKSLLNSCIFTEDENKSEWLFIRYSIFPTQFPVLSVSLGNDFERIKVGGSRTSNLRSQLSRRHNFKPQHYNNPVCPSNFRRLSPSHSEGTWGYVRATPIGPQLNLTSSWLPR